MSKSYYGVGFNSRREHKTKINGKWTPAYRTWRNMLRRCYCADAKRPNYVGCSVTDEWHDFQNFAEWFYDNPYSNLGYHLDKDLLIPGNKIYAPDRCAFVPSQLNTLLNGNGNARSPYPQGVSFYKRANKFRAKIAIDGKPKGLGYFDTEQEAYLAYKKAKEANVKRMALKWQDRIVDNVFDALMQWTLDDK